MMRRRPSASHSLEVRRPAPGVPGGGCRVRVGVREDQERAGQAPAAPARPSRHQDARGLPRRQCAARPGATPGPGPRVDKTHPRVAASLREGQAETLTMLRLGVPPTLAHLDQRHRVPDRGLPAMVGEREALARRGHGDALVRSRDGRGRQAVPSRQRPPAPREPVGRPRTRGSPKLSEPPAMMTWSSCGLIVLELGEARPGSQTNSRLWCSTHWASACCRRHIRDRRRPRRQSWSAPLPGPGAQRASRPGARPVPTGGGTKRGVARA